MKNLYEKFKKFFDLEPEKLILLESVDETSGFFVWRNKLIFATRNLQNLKSIEENTKSLSLFINLFLHPEGEQHSFPSGEYNVIKLELTSEANILVFYDLCVSFSKQNTMDIVLFFKTLRKLFQNSHSERFNLIGFVGELFFLHEMFEKYNINLFSAWHKIDSYDKYDFTINLNTVLEIKTTSKTLKAFRLKHDQIFNSRAKVFLGCVQIKASTIGMSVRDFLEYFKKAPEIATNIAFFEKLNKELVKISDSDFYDKFELVCVDVFNASNLQTIDASPKCISEIEYLYDFSGENPVSISNFKEAIQEKHEI